MRRPARADAASALRRLSAALVFAAAFALANVAAGRIELPFSNPQRIVGTLTGIRYNPSNNRVRFLVITLLPTMALAAIFFTAPETLVSRVFPARPASVNESSATTRPHRILRVPLLAITVLVALNATSYMSAGQLETYEEGLPLSAGLSYLNGGVPYRDFALFHGLYDEPLRVAAAFKLFGPSIGAMRTFQSINKVITYCLLSWFLVRLFRQHLTSVFAVLLALHFLAPQGTYDSQNRGGIPILHSVIVMPRDMALFAFLIALTFLAARIRRNDFRARGILGIAAAWSAVPGLGYIHSMESGVYLLAAFTVIAPACYFLFFRNGPSARPFLIGCAIGLSSSATLLLILIHGAVQPLLRLTNFLASDAMELQFSHPYPYAHPSYIAIDLMIALNCFWVVKTFFTHWRAAGLAHGSRSFLCEHLIESALLLLSMLYYRNALGRCDWIHVAYALPAPTILFMYLLSRHVLAPLSTRVRWMRTAVITAIWILVSVQGSILLSRTFRRNLVRENFPLAEHDNRYLPDRWKGLVPFLRDNLSPGESFYTMSDELSLYYFVGRVCPVRFPLLTMVLRDAEYQREIIADLAAHNVKYVVVEPKSIYFRIDGIANDMRAPLVFEYVGSHYRRYRETNGQIVLIRNGS